MLVNSCLQMLKLTLKGGGPILFNMRNIISIDVYNFTMEYPNKELKVEPITRLCFGGGNVFFVEESVEYIEDQLQLVNTK